MYKYDKDTEGIVTITMDMPGRSANVINNEFGKGFSEAFEKAVAEPDLKGIIIASAKGTFLAGADLDNLFQLTDAKQIFEMCEGLKAQFRKLETLGKPVVAAINGSALGGGFELCLACHRRIALNNPKAELGLPEVSLGLLPGGGGVARMVRLLGLQAAFPLLTEGKRLKVKAALSAGIIHEIAETPEEMVAKAKEWIKANPNAKAPWDDKGYKIPGGTPSSPAIAQMLPIVPAMSKKKTYGNYPAVDAIIAAAVEGAQTDFDTACRIESRYFTHLATGKVSKNMITAFWYNLNEINGGKSRPQGYDKYTTRKLGVLGAGMMGAGIAYVSALAGMEVVLKDVDQERAEKGKDYSRKLVDGRVSKGRMKREDADAVLARIKTTGDVADLAGCDLIIEAVFENRELKARVTKETEAVMDPTGVFASNTSTLPITGLAEASVRPEKFIGLHFFSPVDKMPLVEIIRGEKTDDETLARGFDYVKQIRKTPIVVNDSRGFYTSRVFATYVLEGIAMLGEGQHPRAIESAGMQAGMPVGPLALTDEVSLSLMEHIRQQTIADLKAEGKSVPDHPAYAVSEVLLSKNRAGKAAGAGFYEYPQGGKKFLWPELTSIFPQKEPMPQKEMIERMMFIQSIETARCVEEGVLMSVPDANIGSIFGWGFAPFKGGTLQYINDYGVAEFVQRAKALAAQYGERFSPPAILEKMAEKGETFK